MLDVNLGTKPYDWKTALEAVRQLLKDPNDVAPVFRIINALPGRSLQRVARRMQQTATGRRLLHERPSLSAALRDRDRLSAMPDDSLAAAYLRFCAAENIVTEDLVTIDEQVERNAQTHDPELLFVWQYLRDTHDLWHVVTGYRGDLLGEPALQAFNFAQNFAPGIGLIAAAVFLRGSFLTGVRRIILEGFVHGLRARPLIEEDWERLLPLPLEKVRQYLHVQVARPYRAIRLSDFPGGKLPS